MASSLSSVPLHLKALPCFRMMIYVQKKNVRRALFPPSFAFFPKKRPRSLTHSLTHSLPPGLPGSGPAVVPPVRPFLARHPPAAEHHHGRGVSRDGRDGHVVLRLRQLQLHRLPPLRHHRVGRHAGRRQEDGVEDAHPGGVHGVRGREAHSGGTHQ